MAKRFWLGLVLASAPLLIPPTVCAQEDEGPRWIFSARIGGASTDVDKAQDDGHETGVFGSLGVGLALRENFIIAMEGVYWRRGDDWLGAIWIPAATFYPGLGGLNLRGGLGVTALESIEEPTDDLLPVLPETTTKANGFGLMGGLGYDWQMGSRFLIGPRFEAGWLSFEDDQTALYISLNVGATFVL